ncbi:MAG: sulfatase [Verrucomicrobia bacterium]|nr:sulfatase [Verrucomicrobiota bacterium]MCH8511880.1 sulfatase [Kiritimatiellia bacterium]
MSKLNFVYIVCHDLGRAMGCYGAGVPTPHLDRFASESIRFTRAHCASPACSPSRACAMSGLHAHRSGAIGLAHMGWPLDLNRPTTVDDFNGAGYQTILSGINHERHPRTDRYEVDLTREWSDWMSDRAVDNALRALAQRDESRPFYLNIATQEPHACTWPAVGGRIPAIPSGAPVWDPPGMPDYPGKADDFRRFAAAIAFMDHHIGRFLTGLDRLGLRESTVVVFTTDHGISGPRAKGTLYGLGTEIAMLLRLPDGRHAGETRETLLSNLDFRPTWCEAFGLAPPENMDGKSFWSVIDQPDAAHRDHLYLERNYHGEKLRPDDEDWTDLYDPIRAIRTPERLYIRHFRPDAWPDLVRPDEELYDLEQDPAETSPISDATGLRAFRDQLMAEAKTLGDFVPGPPPPRPEAPGWGKNWHQVDAAADQTSSSPCVGDGDSLNT